MELDATDKKLLNLLQQDCKKTTKAYALELGLSTTAVFERIKRLERNAIITDYVGLVDKKKVQKSFTVYCHIKLVQHTKENVLRFEHQIQQLQEVQECQHISGDYDYIVLVNVANMQEYREFMVNKLTAIDQIGSTQSSFVINQVKKTTAVYI
ncbi:MULTISPECIES: Lrp/AsnC family transcriptional regulator [Croceivirga]|uniref:AsnC family transcriptional regulator n=1 Tax=Croceivirga radicis TaxID=1929488 RepID=A0A1V6LT44_9FLAO|nr:MULTISPECIES: Lrp/AsnC family transcriptional regulator [Croceivirga]NJB35782.1 Lrp/AsnC family transcriptional regulator [Croceivirga sp. JEA036]OQD43318.1 AsnC family transcriptional regulator [Croceivirga radicis]